MSDRLTHFDEHGRAVMVDVSNKKETGRQATCGGQIRMNEAAFLALSEGTGEKGDVLSVARIAGIMAAKRCADLIPLAHPIPLERIAVEFELCPELRAVKARCTVSCTGKTGVEMEALTGVSVALMTVYDMLKAVDRGMVISEICLLRKSGGKSGDYARPETCK